MELLNIRKKRKLGNFGEDIATNKLLEMGFELITRNYFVNTHAEIDIIVKDKDGVIRFVEVKTRTDKSFGELEETISKQKVVNIKYAATKWLITNNFKIDDTDIAFDFFGLLLNSRGEILEEKYIPDFID